MLIYPIPPFTLQDIPPSDDVPHIIVSRLPLFHLKKATAPPTSLTIQEHHVVQVNRGPDYVNINRQLTAGEAAS